jgi:hypothetical protein
MKGEYISSLRLTAKVLYFTWYSRSYGSNSDNLLGNITVIALTRIRHNKKLGVIIKNIILITMRIFVPHLTPVNE